MVDIHCHIVPGVDDGAVSLEMSLAMIEEAKRSGVTAILTTPHIRGMAEETARHAFHKRAFQTILDAEPAMELHLGGEVRVTPETKTVIERPEFTVDEHSKYILLELEFEQVPQYFPQLLFAYRLQGITPVLAHPERNIGILRHPEQALELVRQGARLQVTTGSLTGELGESFQECAVKLVECGLVTFLASDAHNITSRRFTNWPAAREVLQEMAQQGDALRPILPDDLCTHNPMAVCRGTALTEPEWDEATMKKVRERLSKNSRTSRKRKRFFWG
ncbi:MAG TPA: CpsB/CapC family capsule biosynthesis tyrosine phosphatase [Candidatus Kapabacteria bacterium]|jgi:protein-tyrosine phosphatase